MKNQRNKGITLIALIITIIVLLILAGVTISAIAGNESIPAKGNEASQKNDISNVKDDITLTAVTAKAQGMETAYVTNGGVAQNPQNVVAKTVIEAVEQKYLTNNQVGGATITVDVPRTDNVITDNATISITTSNYEVEGTISLDDGLLTWNEIENNVPRIKLNKTDLTLAPGGTATLSVKFKQLEETTIEWTSSNANVATVANGVVTIKTTAKDDDTAIITAKATYGNTNYTATCSVLVAQVSTPATQALINTPTMIGADVMNYTANNVSDWQVFYATENEVFIISKDVLETDTAIGGTDETSNGYNNGSGDIADESYGQIWNNLWITACKNTTEGKSTLNNAKTVAYLCDSSKWTRYKTNIANYAVGGATLELLEKSVEIKNTDAITTSLEASKNGYNKTINQLDSPYYKINQRWWIASPLDNNTFGTGGCLPYIDSGVQGGDYPYSHKKYNFGIRPLVSIPMNKVKIIGNKVKIDK